MLHRRRLLNFNYKRKLTFKITFAFFPSLVAFVLQAQSPCRTASEGTESHLTTTSMKGTTFLHIYVVTPICTPINIVTPLKPKEINFLLTSTLLQPP
jgi:hypothetical protein